MKRFLLVAGVALGFIVLACGGPEKPPLTPDGPNETMPVGDDAGAVPAAPAASAPAAPAVPAAPAAPAKK